MATTDNRMLTSLVTAALVLAFTVIVFGAYVRLTDAGLGCPDWPGCYGLLTVPDSAAEIAAAAERYERPLEGGKAWREMIHRYLASSLGLLILVLAAVAWRRRDEPDVPLGIALLLVPLVMFQGALGMWTVTLLLKPLVVTAHLLGGLTILALLWLALLKLTTPVRGEPAASLAPWAAVALAALALQIALGGWTSTNYAALACTDFPTCQGRWWPLMDFREAFVLWRGLGVDYEYGVLETPARTAVHFSHRLWALVTTVMVLAAAVRALRAGVPAVGVVGWCILAALAVQVALGISNVRFGLPLPVAVAHNGVAAVLLLTVVTLVFFSLRHKFR